MYIYVYICIYVYIYVYVCMYICISCRFPPQTSHYILSSNCVIVYAVALPENLFTSTLPTKIMRDNLSYEM